MFPEKEEKTIDVLARTIYGEARGEGLLGMVGVAAVVLNRVKKRSWWGRTVERVCKKKWQFSCWLENDPNRPAIEKVTVGCPVFSTCLNVAALAVNGLLLDPTKGACHYHTKNINPKWAKDKQPCAKIGNHLFYNDID